MSLSHQLHSIRIASRPHCKHLPRMTSGLGPGLVIPDLWQQEAVRALQQGKDVVVQAPTGSGKTYIFELLYPNLKTQAVFTVPTRALANDKLSEWRAGAASHDLPARAHSSAKSLKSRSAVFIYHKRLTIDHPTHRSLSCLRSRGLVGGQALPAFKAARLASRIATIWRACDLVSSRRLARPPRFPISARYSRILFCACVISLQCSTNSAS
jgi:DEAD/DEAH box helicase